MEIHQFHEQGQVLSCNLKGSSGKKYTAWLSELHVSNLHATFYRLLHRQLI